METTQIPEMNKAISAALIPILAEYSKLSPGRVKIIEIQTNQDYLNPPGFQYNIRIQAQAVSEPEIKQAPE